MSRREDFARLVDGDTAVDSPAAAGLVELAAALRTMGRSLALPPDPQFQADLRRRLVAVAKVQAAEPAIAGIPPVRPPSRVAGRRTGVHATRSVGRGRRVVLATAASVAVATSVAGVAVAASRSLPGSPFYDVKRATESVQLWTAHGDAAKGRRHLEFAATRLSEARRLPPTSSHLPSTLTAMDAQTRDGANDLIAASRSESSTAPLIELQQFAHQQYAGLRQLIATSPPALRLREARSAALLELVNSQAAALTADCTGCAGAPAPAGGLSRLLQGTLPVPGSGLGSGANGAGSGPGLRGHHHGNGSGPTTGTGTPKPLPSLPLKLPSSLPSVVPTLPGPVKSLLPTLPTTLPTSLPTLLPTKLPTLLPTKLPSLLPSSLPTLKL
jgi:hypothetical protein